MSAGGQTLWTYEAVIWSLNSAGRKSMWLSVGHERRLWFWSVLCDSEGLPGGSVVKKLPAMQET